MESAVECVMRILNTHDKVYHQWISLDKPTKMQITSRQLRNLISLEEKRRKYRILRWWWPEGMRDIIISKSNEKWGTFVGIICEREPFKELCEIYLKEVKNDNK